MIRMCWRCQLQFVEHISICMQVRALCVCWFRPHAIEMQHRVFVLHTAPQLLQFGRKATRKEHVTRRHQTAHPRHLTSYLACLRARLGAKCPPVWAETELPALAEKVVCRAARATISRRGCLVAIAAPALAARQHLAAVLSMHACVVDVVNTQGIVHLFPVALVAHGLARVSLERARNICSHVHTRIALARRAAHHDIGRRCRSRLWCRLRSRLAARRRRPLACSV